MKKEENKENKKPNLRAMASTPIAMASNLLVIASTCDGLQPTCDGLPTGKVGSMQESCVLFFPSSDALCP